MVYNNKHNLPPEVVKALSEDDYDYNFDPKYISATTLIKSPKERILFLRNYDKIEVEVMDNLWKVFGSACHKIFESKATDSIAERRLSVEMDGMILTGKTDLLVEKERLLRDYKITSAWHIVFGAKEGYRDYVNQLNVYAYLHRTNGFPVDKLEVLAILRDWTPREAAKNVDYPQIPIMRIDIPIWNVEEQERFIKERIALHLAILPLESDDIPVCTPKERWDKTSAYAIYKNSAKIALKVCNTKEEAELFMVNFKKQYPDALRLEERPGKSTKCLDYCQVKAFCNYGKTLPKSC